MDPVEKIREAIKSHEQTEDVVIVWAGLGFSRSGISDVTAIAVIGKPSATKTYSLRWNPGKDGFEIILTHRH